MVTPTQSQSKNDSSQLANKLNSYAFLPPDYISNLDKILGSSNSLGGSNNSNQSQVKDTNPYDKIYSSLVMNKNNDKTETPIYQILNERPVGIPGLPRMVYYVNLNSRRNKVTITIQAGEPAKGQALNTIENWFKTNALERKNIDFRSLYNILVIAQSIVASRGKLIDDLGKTDGIYVSGEIDGNKIKVSYYGNLSVKKLLKGDVKALSTLFGGDKIVIEVNGNEAPYIAALLVASIDPQAAGNLARYYPGTEFEKIYNAQQKGYI
ncbi:MAG: hypothetical protein QXX36_01970 [Candidatus Rehaiarchaeum fermentans]|nr:hypothetical protein [Candidatus Rehaiarchaeum fermentans]MCW1297303.1 hypothetical protein [Candidatus Rehaiarchaeum fermentans]MCW1302372.1 hypothetical protein [Candidatus Rehaiarchaeum fermentans]